MPITERVIKTMIMVKMRFTNHKMEKKWESAKIVHRRHYRGISLLCNGWVKGATAPAAWPFEKVCQASDFTCKRNSLF
jgi:hypothetical protein